MMMDFIAIKAAYFAYKKAAMDNRISNANKTVGVKVLKSLPFFNFDQLFFISFGHIWCGNSPNTNSTKARIDNLNFDPFFLTFKCLSNGKFNI